MASPFDACRLATNRVFDRVGGEDFRLLPQAPPTRGDGLVDVNARPVASSAREQIAFRALWFDKGAALHAHGRSMADSTTRPVAADSPILDYAVEDLANPARPGDLVLRAATGTTYGVAEDTEADIGRRRIRLVEKRLPASTVR